MPPATPEAKWDVPGLAFVVLLLVLVDWKRLWRARVVRKALAAFGAAERAMGLAVNMVVVMWGGWT
jgi:hypothetical protein